MGSQFLTRGTKISHKALWIITPPGQKMTRFCRRWGLNTVASKIKIGNGNWTQTFFLKLFGRPRDIPAKSRDIPPKKFDFPGFEGRIELFGPHPFTWKTPTPLENIRTKKFGFGFFFSSLKKRNCPKGPTVAKKIKPHRSREIINPCTWNFQSSLVAQTLHQGCRATAVALHLCSIFGLVFSQCRTTVALHPWKGLQKGTVAAASFLLGGGV